MTGFNERIIDEFRAHGGDVTVGGFGRARFLDASPGFGEYERRTERVIPVVELHRR